MAVRTRLRLLQGCRLQLGARKAQERLVMDELTKTSGMLLGKATSGVQSSDAQRQVKLFATAYAQQVSRNEKNSWAF